MKASPHSTHKAVDYNAHLWQSAYCRTWETVVRRAQQSIGIAVGVFTLVFLLGWMIELGQSSRPSLNGLVMAVCALLVSYALVFLAHLFYLTPKKFLYEKQKQLLDERERFSAAIAALESRLISESNDRADAALEKLIPILKARNFANPIAGLYEAGVPELESVELDELCRQLVKRQMPHPFADVPGGADYWMWLLQSAVERGVRLSTHRDVLDYHRAVQLESEQREAATAAREQAKAPSAPPSKAKVKAGAVGK